MFVPVSLTTPDDHSPNGARAAAPVAIQALIDRIMTIETPDDAAALVGRLAAPEGPVIVSFLNQHAVNVAWRNQGFAQLLNSANVLLRDGLGVGVCLKLLRRNPGLNMNGTDFIPYICAAHAGRRVLLCGTSQPWLDRAAAWLRRQGCDVVAVMEGFQPDEDYVAAAVAHRPNLLVLAMGMPKQERVAAAIAQATTVPMLIVNGGAIADFWAGRFPRAPLWLRRAHLEWAFRLAREPLRLWRRYLLGGVVFALHIARLRRTMPSNGRIRLL
jgi:exopolysaccharide biosynthesis WecB/TagA/CpsF family protein